MTMRDYETQARTAALRQDFEPAGVPGSGWVTFAALMLGLAGLFNFIAGIAAVANSKVFVNDAAFIFSDLNTWGWIVLVLGVVQVLAAMALLSGSEFARWFGIATAGANAIGQLLFVQAYPFWSLALFAMDILIIYGLAMYAGSRLEGGGGRLGGEVALRLSRARRLPFRRGRRAAPVSRSPRLRDRIAARHAALHARRPRIRRGRVDRNARARRRRCRGRGRSDPHVPARLVLAANPGRACRVRAFPPPLRRAPGYRDGMNAAGPTGAIRAAVRGLPRDAPEVYVQGLGSRDPAYMASP